MDIKQLEYNPNKMEYILDDDTKFYHVHFVNNIEVKKLIGHNDVVELLKRGVSYECTSTYGLYRLRNFKSKVLFDSFHNTGNIE